PGLAVHLGVGGVHLRQLAQRLDDGVADEVGEGHLATAPAGEVVVDDDAVVDEQFGGHRPHAGGGRDLEAGLHVLHDPGGGAAQLDGAVLDVRHGLAGGGTGGVARDCGLGGGLGGRLGGQRLGDFVGTRGR